MDSSKLQKRYEELVNAILSEHKQVFDAQHLFLLFDVIVLLLQEQLGMSGEQMEKRHRNVE